MAMEEVQRLWSPDALKRWPRSVVEGWAIPDSSKRFLHEIGLPLHEDWTMRFDIPVDDQPLVEGKPRLRIIGYDDVVPICIDEEHSGQVIASGPGAVRFINSSVEQFGECLAVYSRYRCSIREMPDDENRAQEFISSIECQLRAIDSAALSEEKHWWPVIVDQMREGLL